MSAGDRPALIRFLESRTPILPNHWDDDTSLLRSGILDSLSLLELILWLEERTGKTLDRTGFDLVGELDTVRHILRYIEQLRGDKADGQPV